jgi:tetratricopeptide (TPR) repeat protein
MELATRPDVAGLPRAAEVLGTAARAAWQRGELDAAQRLADDALRLATTDVEATRAIDVTGTLALFGGDLELARERYLAAAVGRPDYASLPTSAALAAIYDGDRREAERLLRRAEHLVRDGHSLTDRAYLLYARGELETQHDPDAALEAYSEAIELARRSGAGFVEGIASVGLVRLWTSTGQIDEALHGFRWLIEHWRRTGSWIQQWTTLRNLAYLLIDGGDLRTAALLLAAADEAEEASAVTGDPDLEEAWVALAGQLGADGLAGARREAEGLGRVAVVEAALAAIDRLSG